MRQVPVRQTASEKLRTPYLTESAQLYMPLLLCSGRVKAASSFPIDNSRFILTVRFDNLAKEMREHISLELLINSKTNSKEIFFASGAINTNGLPYYFSSEFKMHVCLKGDKSALY